MSKRIVRPLMPRDLMIIAVVGIIVALISVVADKDRSHYEIYQSYSTGECVAMITYNSEHPRGLRQSCPAELPRQYTHRWVQ
jgi:hypothetical protein